MPPLASHTAVHQLNIRAKNLNLYKKEKSEQYKGGTYMKKEPQGQDENGNTTLHLMFNHTEYLTLDWESFMKKNGGRLMTKHELSRWRSEKLRDTYKGNHGKPAPVWVNGEWRNDIAESINA
jgi:hypothetical protein